MDLNLEKTDVEGLVTIEAEDDYVLNLLESCLIKFETIGFVDSYELDPTEELASRTITDLNEHVTLSFTAVGNPDFYSSLRTLKESIAEVIDESYCEDLDRILDSTWSIFFDCTEQFDDKGEDLAYIICNKVFDYADFEVNKLETFTEYKPNPELC